MRCMECSKTLFKFMPSFLRQCSCRSSALWFVPGRERKLSLSLHDCLLDCPKTMWVWDFGEGGGLHGHETEADVWSVAVTFPHLSLNWHSLNLKPGPKLVLYLKVWFMQITKIKLFSSIYSHVYAQVLRYHHMKFLSLLHCNAD